jgi:glycosyltransferase involved in cell wall biosynthesis
MNVLHVVHGYPPAIGGTEFLFQQISERLVAQYGDQVTVFTTNGYNPGMFVDPDQPTIPIHENEELNGVKVRRFPVNNRIAPRIESLQRKAFENDWPFNDVLRTLYHGPISWSMFEAVLHAQADVAVASAFPLLHMYYATLGKRFNRIPLLFHGALHPEQRWSYDRPIIFRAIAACDMYLANTAFERDFVISKGISPRKVRIASPGVDPGPFIAADGVALRRKLGWEDAPVIAFVGQQAAHKGIDTLYRAMRLVWRQLPEVHLIVAGGRTIYSKYLDAILNAFSPQERDRIHLMPNFAEDEKPQIFAACDVFVYPSGHESFGITFVEAWAAGKPVIGCRSGAISTVVDEWQDGLLVPYQDAPQLAVAILELLTDDRLRERMGRRGKEKVLAQHTWDIAVARFRQAYEQAVEESQAKPQPRRPTPASESGLD